MAISNPRSASRRTPTPSTAAPDALATDIDGRLVVPRADPAETASKAAGAPRRQSEWFIGATVAGWPIWWALGVTQFVFPVLGFVLFMRLRRLRHERPIRLPPGFWIWILFLVLVLASGVALNVEAPDTVAASGIGRYLAFTFRFLNYLAVTIAMIYVGNRTERELPRIRVVWWMALLGIWAILLGTLSIAFPDAGFRTLLSHFLPQSLLGDSGLVKLAQDQPILGETSPRPSAPFAFTNAWGNNLSLLLIWLFIAGAAARSHSRRLVLWALIAVAFVPIVYSLNRGMWIGMGISVVVVALRLAIRGHTLFLAGLLVTLMVGGVIFVFSPLQTMVHQRIDTGHSNEIRQSLAKASTEAATHSPLIGFGSTRQTIGSDASIAIGPSPSCSLCGYRDIGSTGQLWLLFIAQGFLGAALYLLYLFRSLWAYRSDWSPLGIAGSLVVLLEIFYSLFYTALTMPLAITLLSIALLWRNHSLRRDAAAQAALPQPALPQPAAHRSAMASVP
jgi:ABC-type multidrug transport system fused ATPase/permease subunit